MITITDLAPGKTYKLQFRAVQGADVSPWSDVKTFEVSTDVLAPAEVSGLAVRSSGSSFRATWNPVTDNTDGTPAVDFDDYVVRVTNGSDSEFYYTRGTVFDFSYEQNRASFGTPKGTVNFSVVARDRAKNAVAFPVGVTATNPSPGAPTNLFAVSVGDGVALKWTAPVDTDIKKYSLFANGSLVAESIGTSMIYSTKDYNINTTFSVAAVDVFDQTGPTSNSVVSFPVPVGSDKVAPAAPGVATATHTVRYNGRTPIVEVSLNWADNVETDLAGYILRWRPTGSTIYSEIRSTSSSVMIDGLAVNTAYDFRLAAYDLSNNVSAYTIMPATTFTDNTPPVKPSPVTMTTRLGNVLVNWDGLTSTGTAQAADFSHAEVYDTTSNRVWGRLTAAGSFVITDLSYNTTYTVALRAYDMYNNVSVPSNATSIVVKPLVDTDIIGQVIDGAKIVNGTINASDKVISNSIITRHIAANAIQSGQIAANAITADKILSGSIGTDALAVGAIRPENAVGLGANRVTDPGFEDAGYWQAVAAGQVEGFPAASGGMAPATLATTLAKAGGRVLNLGFTGTSGDGGVIFITPSINVPTSRRIYAGTWCMSQGSVTGAGANSQPAYGIEWTLSNGSTSVDIESAGPPATAFAWTYSDGIYEAPLNAVSYRVFLQRLGLVAGQTLRYWFDEVVVSDAVGTDPSKQNVSITPSGIRLFDVEGTEVISLTSMPPNYLNINKLGSGESSNTVASISEDGNISGQDLEAAGALRWRGIDLITNNEIERNDNFAIASERGQANIISGLPWGLVGYGAVGTADGPACDTAVGMGWFEIAVDLIGGRLYQINFDQIRYSVTAGSTAAVQVYTALTYKTTGSASVNDPVMLTASSNYFTGTAGFQIFTPGASTVHRAPGAVGQVTTYRMLLKYGLRIPTSGGVTQIKATGNDVAGLKGLVTVYDIGPDRTNLARASAGGGSLNQAPAPTVPVTVPTKIYKTRYPAAWSGTYRNDTLHTGSGNAIKQGTFNGVTNYGLVGFNDAQMRTDLSGATVKSCVLYAYANHWYNNSGGTAIIGTSPSGGSRPAGLATGFRNRVNSSRWPKPGARVVDLTAQIGREFQSGATKSIIFGDGRFGLEYYGSFDGAGVNNQPYIEITYEK